MTKQNSIAEIFFRHLMQYQFDPEDLDPSRLLKHIEALQVLAHLSNSGISIFDLSKREIVFYSSNYGRQLGYQPDDYGQTGQQFFENKIHEDDQYTSSVNGVMLLKLFGNFSNQEKLSYKLINEFRIKNSENEYIRLIEQHQVLELDRKGQIWLLLSIVDIAPNQEDTDGMKSQLLNFKSGKVIPIPSAEKLEFDLTKRELEILKMVKQGFLSKEISDKLAISVHTVNTHRQRFLEKLGANNSLEAIRFASRFGLLE